MLYKFQVYSKVNQLYTNVFENNVRHVIFGNTPHSVFVRLFYLGVI